MVKIINKVKAEGKTEVTYPDGRVEETAEVVEEFIVDKPMANVGLKVGLTANLGDYESLRVDVSLFMPSETDKKSLDKTFKKVDKWVEKKMQKIKKEMG